MMLYRATYLPMMAVLRSNCLLLSCNVLTFHVHIFIFSFRPQYWMTSPPRLADKSDWGQRFFRKPFIFPSPFGESIATPKRGCSDVLTGYICHRDSNVDYHTTVTPGPPTCRVVTSRFQRHPSPDTVATSPSALDLIVLLTEYRRTKV